MQRESIWEKLKQNLREGAHTAAVKAEHLGQIGRARLNIARTRQALRQAFTHLGQHTYEVLSGDTPQADVPRSEGIQDHIRAIQDLEHQLQIDEIHLKELQTAKDAGESEKTTSDSPGS